MAKVIAFYHGNFVSLLLMNDDELICFLEKCRKIRKSFGILPVNGEEHNVKIGQRFYHEKFA